MVVVYGVCMCKTCWLGDCQNFIDIRLQKHWQPTCPTKCMNSESGGKLQSVVFIEKTGSWKSEASRQNDTSHEESAS